MEWFDGNGARLVSESCHCTLSDFDSEREVIAFHRHDGRFPEGHYHLGAGLGTLPPPLDKVHIPAPDVSLEAFVAMVIMEFGVRPLRNDWREVLFHSAT